ncbi:MAG TPA: hypothetical protein VI704_02840 [Bacteroidota bacterium]|nr:hypothetical protein [Bacteroidota bacterium]
MRPRRTYTKCKDVARHVLDNLNLDLNRPRYQKIKKHLDSCPNCDAYLDGAKKTITLYRLIPLPHAPHSLRRMLISVVKL